jgi:hypothetical protein
VPVSKKRKPKRPTTSQPKVKSASNSGPSAAGITPKKNKLSRQQIIFYIISILVVLSMAIGYLVGNGRSAPIPTPTAAPTVSAPEPTGESENGNTTPTTEAPATQ